MYVCIYIYIVSHRCSTYFFWNFWVNLGEEVFTVFTICFLMRTKHIQCASVSFAIQDQTWLSATSNNQGPFFDGYIQFLDVL